MGLLRSSIAEVYCPASRLVGSGYFCASRLVLTAGHVIAGALSNAGPPEIPPYGTGRRASANSRREAHDMPRPLT
jgi:hypothetical protein